MNHRVLRWSLVGLWKEALTDPPEIDRRFWMDLFGDPYNTVVGFSGPAQFQATLPQGEIHRSVTVASHRIEFQSPDLEQLADVYGQVMERLADALGEDCGFSAVGLNTDHEWAKLDVSAAEWVGERFVESGLQGVEWDGEVQGLGVRFQLHFANPQRRYRVSVEPREGMERGLFLHANDHRETDEPEPPSPEACQDLLEQSTDLLQEALFSPLGLE